jgi:hypothetical protein
VPGTGLGPAETSKRFLEPRCVSWRLVPVGHERVDQISHMQTTKCSRHMRGMPLISQVAHDPLALMHAKDGNVRTIL